MNWQALLKAIKAEGYTGKDDDLSAVKAFVSEKWDAIEVGGNAVDIDAEHTKAYPPKPKLDITEEAREEEIERKVGEQVRETIEHLGLQKRTPKNPPEHDVKVGKDNLTDDPKGGFKSIGEFLMEVKNAGGNGVGAHHKYGEAGSKLERWTKATLSTYGSEGVGADGGFAVVPEFRSAIESIVTGEESLLARCRVDPVSGNSLTLTLDETTPWQTAGGIQAEWEGEAGTKAQSKPALTQVTRKLRKVVALIPLTDELLQDAPAIESFVMRKAPEIIDFKIGEAIVRGTGVGMPLGFLNSSALITVSAESSQPADTIKATNVQKMYMRMYAPYRRNAVWLINQDVEVQLQQMVVVGKTDAGTSVAVGGLVYIPPGTGLSSTPYGTLLGRPIIPTQHCETLGDVGDICLVDLEQYWAIRKSSGIETATSIHLWFDQDVTALRFVYRLDGGPLNTSVISPRDGSNTMSPFIVLAAR